MGRPRNRRLKKGVSRRQFLKQAGALSALASAGPVFAARAAVRDGSARSLQAADSAGVFVHGIASGDPKHKAVMLWTRVTPMVSGSLQVGWSIATDQDFTNVVQSGTVDTDADRDYTVKVDVDGLKPETSYWYRFSAEGIDSPVGRTRTLPNGEVSRARFAVVSCASLAHGYFNAYSRLAERDDIDFVVHLGDYIYEYGTGEYGNVRAYEPDHEIITLDDYRTRHAQYKGDADVQALHARHPVIAIWDDHETANNSWMGGAENHDPATEGGWSDRVAAATQAYHEWMPIRTDSSGDLLKIQRGFDYGDLFELTMLETRLQARSEQLGSDDAVRRQSAVLPTFTQTGEFTDPDRTMAGSDQEKWLYKRLRNSEARWKLIGQGVMVAQVKLVGTANAVGLSQYLNADAWDGYDPARQRLLDVLAGDDSHAAVNNVVVLTGDIHSSWACDLTPDPNNPRVALGGYDPETGEGSLAVELVGTSVTSPALSLDSGTPPGLEKLITDVNPHVKYVELTRHGYLIVDVTPERLAGEWWYVDTVTAPSSGETLAVTWEVLDGANRLSPPTA